MKVYLALWMPDDIVNRSISFLGAFSSREKAEWVCEENLYSNHLRSEEEERQKYQYRIIESCVDVENGTKNDYEVSWSRLE